tara:strand:- start:940 stop:1380 length:441 start_codon:yes stop_codon:yes gene_type:complete
MKGVRYLFLVLVAGVFVYAGILKVLDPKAFLTAILTYEVFPYNWAVAASLGLPYFEILAGAALLVPAWRSTGMLLVAGMLIVFLALILQAFARGLSIDCGCFGPNEAKDSTDYVWVLARDFGLLACLGAYLWLDRRHGGAKLDSAV